MDKTKLNIVYRNIRELKPYKKNAKKHNKEQVERIANSIKEFGFTQPVIIDKNNCVVAGHGRILGAKKAGLKQVPTVMLEDLTEEQIKAYRLVDNKLNESEWDYSLLDEELENLTEDIDMNLFGFDMDEEEQNIEAVEDNWEEEINDNDVRVKKGDFFKLGNNYLLCGDSTKYQDVKKLVGKHKIDLLLTDPPYGIDYVGKTKDKLKIENDNKTKQEMIHFLTCCFKNANEVMREGAVFYIWYGGAELYTFGTACNNVGFKIRENLIWLKNTIVLGRQDYHWKHENCIYGWKGTGHKFYRDRKQSTVMEYDKPTGSKIHPTMKPVRLFDYQIESSTKEHENVLDLFGGSGTTIIACEQNNRRAFVMEYDEKYCQAIINRWESLTGKEAILL